MNETIHAQDFPYDFQWVNTSHPLSLFDDLQGYVVLVHFWTSSSVHCQNTISTLAYLEQRFADRSFAVVGVHTGKFTFERDLSHVGRSTRRFGVRHPVVIDERGELWKAYSARTWPFLALVDAAGQVRFQGGGEPDAQRMASAIEFLLEEAAADGYEPYTEILHDEGCDSESLAGLSHPAGLALDSAGRLWIADTGRHRILAVDPRDFTVQLVVGSGHPGATDGAFAQASFFYPRGLWAIGDALFVADTGNHLIRRVDLQEGRVDAVLGTGRAVVDLHGGDSGPSQPIHSPWSMAGADCDLFVAMAGTHQIWRVELETMTAAPFVGSGAKGVRDGRNDVAMLAQPVCLASEGNRLVFVDSDSSSLRAVDIDSGEVSTLISGGLYEWGDRDGADPKLQCPRSVVFHGAELIVADSGNHKIRRSRGDVWETISTDVCEPEALLVDGDTLFVADTGNSRIVKLDLVTLEQEEVLVSDLPRGQTAFGSDYVRCVPVRLPPMDEAVLRFPMDLSPGATLCLEAQVALDTENFEGHALLVDSTVRPDVDGVFFTARGIATGDAGEGSVVRLRLTYTTSPGGTSGGPGHIGHLQERRLEVPVSLVSGAARQVDIVPELSTAPELGTATVEDGPAFSLSPLDESRRDDPSPAEDDPSA